MGASRITSILGIFTIMLGLTVPPAQATPKPPTPKIGADCKTANDVQKVKTKYLFCLRENGIRTWVFGVEPPSTKKSMITSTNRWLATLPFQGTEEMVAVSQPQQAHADALTVAQQNRDANANAMAQSGAKTEQLQNEINGLPNQIAQALTIADQARAAMQPSLNELKSADATVSSLSSAYYSAVDTQYIITAEIVLCTFGFRTCTPGQYDAALSQANATVSRYESARASAAGARAKYDGYYRDYKIKYDNYSTLFNRKAVANTELIKANGHTQNLQSVMPSLEDTLSRAHKVIDNRALILALVPALTKLETTLRVQVRKLKKAKEASSLRTFNGAQSTWLQLTKKRSELVKNWTELQSIGNGQ